MADRCPRNPEGDAHYWIIDSRTGLAQCRYCDLQQKYDIDALIYPDYKEKPRTLSKPSTLKPAYVSQGNCVSLQFIVDIAMVEDLRMLKVNLEERLNTANHQAEVYRGISYKQRDKKVKRSAMDIAERMQQDAQTLTRQVKALSHIIEGPKP